MLIRIALLAAFSMAAVASPASAEPTPALPFFSRPFPAGYATASRCLTQRRIQTRRGMRTTVVDLCGPVISAKD